MSMSKIVGILAALLIAAGVAMNYGDLKRYMKIERM